MSDTIPLVLDDEIREAVATAFDTGNYITVAYIGADGWPHISRRGTTQVIDDQTFAMWVRKRDDGLATAISDRPQVTLFYVDLTDRREMYTMYGNAYVSTDPAIAERVWNGSPAREQDLDKERKGLVVVVDLVRVIARIKRNFVMQR
jgi:predicted pyridoxine 5'-phosphate oxidase superfamily flavin-nucleotide-binding protein